MLALAVALFVTLAQLPLAQLPAGPKHLTAVPSVGGNPASAGSKVSLFVDVTPDRGIHVYAPGAKDYLPISVKLEPSRGVTAAPLKYPKSQTLVFEGEKIPVYDKPFRLVQDVTLDRSVKPGETIAVTATLHYQACTEKICYIPATAPLRWTVTVSK